MHVVSRLVPLLLASLALVTCDDVGILVPIDPDEVTITLAVSGGVAGVGYTIAVDGGDRTVVGVSCTSSCTFDPGEVLLPVSSEQVAALAGALEDAGVAAWNGREFGDECCDQFHYDLAYDTDDRSVRLSGGAGRLPDELARAISQVHALVYGVVPALISRETRDVDWPRDPLTLISRSVDGLRLTATLQYGGGCGQHRIDLVIWGDWIEPAAVPPHINALLAHDDGNDPCDAVIADERTFDLRPLRDAYEWAFGPIGDERPTVLLRLWDPVAASPLGRLIEVRL